MLIHVIQIHVDQIVTHLELLESVVNALAYLEWLAHHQIVGLSV